MLNKNFAKRYYVGNNRLHMQLYCQFSFFLLVAKTNDHLKCTFSSERAFKFHLAQRIRMVVRSVGYWHKTVLRKLSKKMCFPAMDNLRLGGFF